MGSRDHRYTLDQGKINLTAAGSATVFALLASNKWHLLNGFMAYKNATTNLGITLMEIDGTNSNTILQLVCTATFGCFDITFEDYGFAASAAATRLIAVTDGTGTVTGMFTGYKSA